MHKFSRHSCCVIALSILFSTLCSVGWAQHKPRLMVESPIELREQADPLAQARTFLYAMDDPFVAAEALRQWATESGIDIYMLPDKMRKRPRTYEIHPPGGEPFLPDPGIDPSLLDPHTDVLEGGTVICILQVWRELCIAEEIELLEMGVRPYLPLSEPCVVVRLPFAKVHEITQLKGVRWVGLYEPEHKYRSDLPEDVERGVFAYVLDGPSAWHVSDLEALGAEVVGYDRACQFYEVQVSGYHVPLLADLWWVFKVAAVPEEVLLGRHDLSVNFRPRDSRDLICSNDSSLTGSGVTLGVRDNAVYEQHPELLGKFQSGSELDDVELHGTHVCGIAAGRAKSIQGPWGTTEIRGIAPDASILFRRLGWAYWTDFGAFRDGGVQISNHSYSFADSYEYDSWTEDYDGYCDDDDMIIIAAVGNFPGDFFPCNPSLGKNVIAVGSVNYVTNTEETIGERAEHSTTGPTLWDDRLKPELVAPGGGSEPGWPSAFTYGVVSTSSDPWEIRDADDNIVWQGGINNDPSEYPEWESDDFYIRLTGTSMATPHVTGLAGKVREWKPDLGSEIFRALLINTTLPIKDNSSDELAAYATTEVGYGLANAFSVTHYYQGESQRFLFATGWLYEDDDPLYDDWGITVPSGTDKLTVTMAYNDEEGELYEDDPLIDDLDLGLISPTGDEYWAWTHKPPGVSHENPLEKMIIENPQAGSWTVRARFTSWPDNPFVYSRQKYALVAHAILKTPELTLSVDSQYTQKPGEDFTIAPQAQNSGGYIAVGVTLEIKDGDASLFGPEAEESVYIGNLMYEGASASHGFSLTAPNTPGTYHFNVEANGANRELPDPIIVPVTVEVVGAEITVLVPNGGEKWEQGTAHTIEWSWTGDPGNVDIDLYSGGSYHSHIAANTSCDGSYLWNIPSDLDPGTNYTVRITSDWYPDVWDESDGYFSIVESSSITVIVPNGGEQWEQDTCHDILWTWTGDPGDYVKIELFKGGSYYSTIVPSTANDGIYNWCIPSDHATGSDFKVKISSTDDPSIWDDSNGNFSIVEPQEATITVLVPNGGENWLRGDCYDIRWTWTGYPGDYVKIELYKGGSYYSTIASSTPNDGIYNWCIPSDHATGSDFKVKISSTDDPSIWDDSDSYFTITDGDASITVTSPKSGDVWMPGTLHDIAWDWYGEVGNTVRIELYKAGSHHMDIEANTANDGTEPWMLPVEPPEAGDDFRARVTSIDHPDVFGESGIFAIPLFVDINADRVVDIADLVLVSIHFAREVGDGGDPVWGSIGDGSGADLADVNNDGRVDIADLVKVSIHFGETW